MDHNGFGRQTQHFPSTIKTTGQTQHDVLRDVSYNFSLVYDLLSEHNTCLFVHIDVFTTYTIIFFHESGYAKMINHVIVSIYGWLE